MLVAIVALKVSSGITDIGAYAGLASILGLAVLSLLYFGQARELKRLRDWAGRAPERTAELQEQANAAAAAAAAGQPQRRIVAQPAASTPAPARASAQAPATAAGAAGATAVTAAGAPAAPGAVRAPGAPGAAPANGVSAAPGGQETQALPALTPPPTQGGQGPLPPAVPSVAAPMPIGPEPPPATEDNPVPLRQVSAAAAAAPRRRPDPVAAHPAQLPARPVGRIIAIVVAALIAVVLVIVIGSSVFGGGDSSSTTSTVTKATTPKSTSTPAATPSTSTPTPAPVDKSAFRVFVLNGTTTNGGARGVAMQLVKDGFVSAGTNTATEQNAPRTQVFYAQGKKRQATAVAKDLDVPASDVLPAIETISTQSVAQQGGKPADVIVQIGANQPRPTP